MDLRLTGYDLDITNGALSFVSGIEAVRQDIEMALRTWLQETPYDRNAGVPYLQVIFRRGTTPATVRFLIEQKILSRRHVTEVLSLESSFDPATRQLTISGRVRALNTEIDISTEVQP